MNSTSPTGLEPRKTDTPQSEISSSVSSSELRLWVAGETQMLRELIAGPLQSDAAAKLTLDMMTQIAVEVGQEKFHLALLQIVNTYERRPANIVATMRKVLGLNPRLDAEAQSVAEAWELVTGVVSRHVKFDVEGNAYLSNHVSRVDGKTYSSTECPDIPPSILHAVACMGGWKALHADRELWWGQRFQTFKTLWRG